MNVVQKLTHELPKDLDSYKTGKYQEKLKVGLKQSLVLSLPSKNNTLVTVGAKITEKTDVKDFLHFPFLLDFFALSY